MNAVFSELAAEHAALRFMQLDAYAFPDVSERLDVMSVPAFVFLRDGNVTDALFGADAALLVEKTKQHAEAAPAIASEPLDDRLRALTTRSPVMLFMKGTPAEPRCGFSRTICELLQAQNISFSSFDILSDEEVRQGLKTFANWPSYPQLYADGKLLGGLDIVQEMHEEGELHDALPASFEPVD
jgi:Grx4 family monothiol glutaredoxin